VHWTDIEKIAVELEENYSEEEIPEYNLQDLTEMILSLKDFEDQEVEVDENVLKQIMEYWIDIRNEK
jgi:FeS assembly protein IscX